MANRRITQAPPSAVPTTETRTIRVTPRVSPTFFLLQTLIVQLMAKAGAATADIAAKLGVDRSYVIRLSHEGVPLGPTNDRERALLEIASGEDFARRIQNLGLKGLLGGESLPIVLAGNAENPRPKLGTLAERRAAKEAAPAPEPATAPTPESAPKVARAKKAPKEAAPAEPAKEPKPSRVKGAKTKDSVKAAESMAAEVVKARRPRRGRAPLDTATADDIIGV